MSECEELQVLQSGSWEIRVSEDREGNLREEQGNKKTEMTVQVVCVECGESFKEYNQKAIDHIKSDSENRSTEVMV